MKKCIASGELYHHKRAGVWPCQGRGGTQLWLLTRAGELRRDDR